MTSLRKIVGPKVPWRLLEDALAYTTGTDATLQQELWEGGIDIYETFVVTPPTGKTGGDIRWSSAFQSKYQLEGNDRDPKVCTVTKDHLVQFCRQMFGPILQFPKLSNYPKDWFVLVLILQAAHHKQVSTDDEAPRIQKAQAYLAANLKKRHL
jgi:hypothetical protein